jgi:hypothetical protein
MATQLLNGAWRWPAGVQGSASPNNRRPGRRLYSEGSGRKWVACRSTPCGWCSADGDLINSETFILTTVLWILDATTLIH